MHLSVIFLLVAVTEILTYGYDESGETNVQNNIISEQQKTQMKGDSGELLMKVDERPRRRRRRSAENSQAPYPAQSPFVSSNIQSSYFLGQCLMCPPGHPGPVGLTGLPGISGRDGIPGQLGRDGRDQNAPSCKGDESNPQPRPVLNANITVGGVTYVRWGRTTCPDFSQFVYEGVAAGSQDVTSGSAVNQLCLPQNPIYDNPVSGVGSTRSFLYGLEYQIDMFPGFNSRLWHEVPCTVCKAPGRYSMLMIPGRNVCPSDEWTLEYGGYLMAERTHTAHKRSMFICVDREMQTVDRTYGYAEGGGAHIALVESRCASSNGGLPCGPYVDGYEMTCAICTH